jgi:putative acetyltransferase
MAIIRYEHHSDINEIRLVNERAFKQPDEADLVDELRAAGKIVVSLVAEANRSVVGHILFSRARIEGSSLKVVGLAPMAVLPEHQGRGIGSVLVSEGLNACRSLGYDAVIVLGHPDYYPRFGFLPADRFGLVSQWDAVPGCAFMAIELRADALQGVSGVARYAPEFDRLAPA